MKQALNVNGRFEPEWDDRKYFLSNGAFYDAKTFLKAPITIADQLRGIYRQHQQQVCRTVRSVPLLIKYAREAKEMGSLKLAEELTERALATEPRNPYAIALLSSVFRNQRQPRKAVEITNDLPNTCQTAAVLTSRAAALCDLGMSAEAERTIRKVLHILRNAPRIEATEAFAVLRRAQQSGDG